MKKKESNFCLLNHFCFTHKTLVKKSFLTSPRATHTKQCDYLRRSPGHCRHCFVVFCSVFVLGGRNRKQLLQKDNAHKKREQRRRMKEKTTLLCAIFNTFPRLRLCTAGYCSTLFGNCLHTKAIERCLFFIC